LPVFGRDHPGGHEYESALRQLVNSRRVEDRAKARNVMHDHRVSERREELLDGVVGRPVTPKTLADGVTRYRLKLVRDVDPPHFVDRPANGQNMLSRVSGDVLLATVVDVSRLADLFRSARAAGDRTFESFPKAPDNEEGVRKFLERRLVRAPRAEVRRFVAAVLRIMNGNRPFNPTWVTPWADFSRFRTETATRWLEISGVPVHSQVPHWVFVLCYTVREGGGILVRPAILDAGWSAEHFPSPPRAKPIEGGFCMDLRTSPPAEELLREYIHPQPWYKIQHWDAAGRLQGLASGDSTRRLKQQRANHHALLVRKYGADVEKWMDKPV